MLDGTKIKALRTKLKLTQMQAAELAGMPQPHWVRLESGRRPDPKLSTALAVCQALGLGNRVDKLLS